MALRGVVPNPHWIVEVPPELAGGVLELGGRCSSAQAAALAGGAASSWLLRFVSSSGKPNGGGAAGASGDCGAKSCPGDRATLQLGPHGWSGTASIAPRHLLIATAAGGAPNHATFLPHHTVEVRVRVPVILGLELRHAAGAPHTWFERGSGSTSGPRWAVEVEAGRTSVQLRINTSPDAQVLRRLGWRVATRLRSGDRVNVTSGAHGDGSAGIAKEGWLLAADAADDDQPGAEFAFSCDLSATADLVWAGEVGMILSSNITGTFAASPTAVLLLEVGAEIPEIVGLRPPHGRQWLQPPAACRRARRWEIELEHDDDEAVGAVALAIKAETRPAELPSGWEVVVVLDQQAAPPGDDDTVLATPQHRRLAPAGAATGEAFSEFSNPMFAAGGEGGEAEQPSTEGRPGELRRTENSCVGRVRIVALGGAWKGPTHFIRVRRPAAFMASMAELDHAVPTPVLVREASRRKQDPALPDLLSALIHHCSYASAAMLKSVVV